MILTGLKWKRNRTGGQEERGAQGHCSNLEIGNLTLKGPESPEYGGEESLTL